MGASLTGPWGTTTLMSMSMLMTITIMITAMRTPMGWVTRT
jgi:hypothetical protein